MSPAAAVRWPIICIDRQGHDCQRDERPAVGGREAERNWRHAYGDLGGGQRVIDFRNGRFLVLNAPVENHWGSNGGDYCTYYVSNDTTGLPDQILTPPPYYVHVLLTSAQCRAEAMQFARSPVYVPFQDDGVRESTVRCTSIYAGDCFAALRRLRALVSLPANDRHLRLPGSQDRDAEAYLAQIRSFAGRSNLRIDLGEPCVRFELGDKVAVCEERGSASIYFQPQPYD